MSIQNRLLLIYTTIFSVAFILIALIVYVFPRNRLLAQIDNDLDALASEFVQPGPIPDNLVNFETASTFIIVIDVRGEIVARSSNLSGFDGYLDESVDGIEGRRNLVRHDETLLRVLTVPLYEENDPNGDLLGYLQVARLLDNFETFNRVLVIALLIGLAAATASLVLAIWLTPSLFKPLEDIAAVARQISNADDLGRRVPDTGRTDEIGVLAGVLNQTLERLEQQFRTQERLLADVSHELRTPLTAIRGNVDLIRRMGGEADPDLLENIQDETKRMTRLVSDLLLLARADSGGLPLNWTIIELDNLFFDVYRQARVLAKSVDLMVVDVDQVSVRGDIDRLKQLLLNLIDNAIKYTPPGGTVSLRLSKDEVRARVDISDTGVGIPPEDLPYIFDRFYRVDKTRSRAQGGSGLGLAIAHWIAKAHRGEILVTSKVGEGTTFSVILPITKGRALSPSETDTQITRPNLRMLSGIRSSSTH